jgi:hypothetical protein
VSFGSKKGIGRGISRRPGKKVTFYAMQQMPKTRSVLVLLAAALGCQVQAGSVKEKPSKPASQVVEKSFPAMVITLSDERPELVYDAVWKSENSERTPKRRIKDPRFIESLVLEDSNIVRPEPLIGLLKAECEFHPDIGCNRYGACGPGQMKMSGATYAMLITFARSPRFSRFSEQYKEQIDAKRAEIDRLSGGYFSGIERLRDGIDAQEEKVRAALREIKARINNILVQRDAYTDIIVSSKKELARSRDAERRSALQQTIKEAYDSRLALRDEKSGLVARRTELRNEFSKLGLFSRIINEGFAAVYGPAIKDRKRLLQRLKDEGEYLCSITGQDFDWLAYLRAQPDAVKRVFERIKLAENANVNMMLADTLLAYHIHSRRNLEKAYKDYNGGTSSAKRTYVHMIRKFYRKYREHIQLQRGMDSLKSGERSSYEGRSYQRLGRL